MKHIYTLCLLIGSHVLAVNVHKDREHPLNKKIELLRKMYFHHEYTFAVIQGLYCKKGKTLEDVNRIYNQIQSSLDEFKVHCALIRAEFLYFDDNQVSEKIQTVIADYLDDLEEIEDYLIEKKSLLETKIPALKKQRNDSKSVAVKKPRLDNHCGDQPTCFPQNTK